MRPLTDDDLHELRATRRSVGFGWGLSQPEIDRLAAGWSTRVIPGSRDVSEQFGICLSDGTETGTQGPRWLFHLLGLCHRSVHIGLATPSGLLVLQRRSRTKDDWPGAWDMAVAGHVPAAEDGAEMGYLTGAWKEIEEEVGLTEADQAVTLASGGLIEVGEPFLTFDKDEERNPPFYNAEVHQLYGAELTAEGLSRLMPDSEELAGLYFCSPEEAWEIHRRDDCAAGLRFSLPRFLDWLIRSIDRQASTLLKES